MSTKDLPLRVASPISKAPRFIGPYPITKDLSPVAVRLKLYPDQPGSVSCGHCLNVFVVLKHFFFDSLPCASLSLWCFSPSSCYPVHHIITTSFPSPVIIYSPHEVLLYILLGVFCLCQIIVFASLSASTQPVFLLSLIAVYHLV